MIYKWGITLLCLLMCFRPDCVWLGERCSHEAAPPRRRTKSKMPNWGINTKLMFLFPHLSICAPIRVSLSRSTRDSSSRWATVPLKNRKTHSDILKLLTSPVEKKCWFIHSNIQFCGPGAANNPWWGLSSFNHNQCNNHSCAFSCRAARKKAGSQFAV